MASDLISRAATLELFIHKCCGECCGCKYEEKEQPYYCALIKSVPSVDAAPVVHARWQTTEAYPHRLYCLNCYHTFVPNYEWVERCNIPTNFCPNCGAKMDG